MRGQLAAIGVQNKVRNNAVLRYLLRTTLVQKHSLHEISTCSRFSYCSPGSRMHWQIFVAASACHRLVAWCCVSILCQVAAAAEGHYYTPKPDRSLLTESM